MQAPSNKMDIHITLGEEEGLQFLTDSTAVITSNPALVENILAESQLKEPPGDDMLLVFHFYVQQGKEKEAVQYFEEALNQTIETDKRSPIQKPLKRPLNKGVVDVVQTPGMIIIKYRFFPKEFSSHDDMTSFENEFDKFQKATVKFSTSLKGHLKHNNKNRTNVKVDYVDLRLYSDEMAPSDFSQLLKSTIYDQEDLEFLFQIPVLTMIGNLKSANFQVKMASFRQLKSYYNKACGEKFQKQEKPFPYVNRGIFRKQVTGFGFFKNKVAIKLDAIYNGEDVLMRLTKVYGKFLSSTLGLF